MIDDRTPNLNLAQPSPGNTLLEDVTRLRSTFETLDTVVSGKQEALGFTPLNAAQKGANGGVCELTADGFVPSIRLPSYVDDVLEFANRAAFPATGEAGKIYLALDTNGQWRWTGSTYVQITASPGTTDAVPEGSVNLYFTPERARAAQMPATAVTQGLVKVGSGLHVTVDGQISVDVSTSFNETVVPITSNGQTAFVVDGGYTAASVQVLLNGVELARNDEFFATDGVNLTLSDGATTSDRLLVRTWKAFLNTGPVSFPAAPVNTAPAGGTTIDSTTATFSGGAFLAPDGATHAATQVQFSTSAGFGTIALDTGAMAAATSVSINLSTLTLNTTYFWRMRYQGSGGQWSVWSTPTAFAMPEALASYIATPTATPAIGDAFEGGYYAGMIWNEVTQSATSTTINIGSKTFTTSDNMSSQPLFYVGQLVEVRSRAAPGNKMSGTVTWAGGTTLRIDVNETNGSGTFTDWSVMARFRVIVSPKASGQNVSIAFKNAQTSSPPVTTSLTEGRKATLAMVADGTSTVYPAAHWCNNLNIGGRTDWYLPARDELELCWRNLKPVSGSNYTTPDRQSSPVQTLGAYTDTDARSGVNKNSAPVGDAYTSAVPAQTAVTTFRTGGLEDFPLAMYWSSSECSATQAFRQNFLSTAYGSQFASNAKTDAYFIRAVRRSII